MASLPSDRTKLALAQSNQNPLNVLGSSQNKNALTEAYDTIDLLNQKVDTNYGTGAIGTNQLAADSVTLAKMADSSVGTAELVASSVTLAKMAAASVGTTQLVDLSVSRAKIANSSVGSSQLDPILLTNYGDIAVQAEFDRRGIDVKKYGAVGDGVTDDTAAFVSAIAAAVTAKAVLYVPSGTYLISSLTLNSSLNIKGTGIGKTILQSTNAGNLFLQIAGTASVENVLLQDLSIYGGNTDIGGIALGTATYYVAYCVFERVEVKSFSKASAYGLSLNSVQEFHSIDSKYNYSYDNIYRPPTGYVTTCAFSGQAGHIGLAVRYGAYINDTPGGSIRFRDQIFEGNSSNAIYSPTGTKCVVFVKDGYFESNNSSAGTATIDIGGSNADGYSQSSLVLDGCEFHASGNPALPVLKLDRVMWRANNTSGLFNQTITTTANTKGILIGNSIQGDAVNYQTVVGNLLGSHCAIENSVVNGLVIIGNPNFVSGLTVAQMFGTGGNGINMPNLGIGELPNASRQFKVANANPVMQLKVLGGTTDKSKWDIRGVGAAGQESLQINMVNDAETVAVSIARFSSVGNMGLGFTGVTMPNANAILDLSSTTTKAFLPPVMTTTQKNAIASPTAGMVVFDSTLGKLCVYTTAWQTITSA